MRQIKCMVDPNTYQIKPDGYETGKIQNRIFDGRFIGKVSELYDKELSGCTIMIGSFSRRYSDKETVDPDSFEGLDLVAIDIDNDFGIKNIKKKKFIAPQKYYLNPQDAIKILSDKGITDIGLIYHTFSSTDKLIKFRIVIPLNRTISDKDEAVKVLESFAALFTIDGVQVADCKAARHINSLIYGAKPNGCIKRNDNAEVNPDTIFNSAIGIVAKHSTYLTIENDLDIIKELLTEEELNELLSTHKHKAENTRSTAKIERAVPVNDMVAAIIKRDADKCRKLINESAPNALQNWICSQFHNTPLIHYSITTTNNSIKELPLEYEGDISNEPETLDMTRLSGDLRAKLRQFPLPIFLGFDYKADKSAYSLHCVLHEDHHTSASIKYYEDKGWRYKCFAEQDKGHAFDIIGLVEELQNVDYIEASDFVRNVLGVGLNDWQQKMLSRAEEYCNFINSAELAEEHPELYSYIKRHIKKFDLFIRYAKKKVAINPDLENDINEFYFYGSYRKLASEMRLMLCDQKKCSTCANSKTRYCKISDFKDDKNIRDKLNLLSLVGLITKVDVEQLPDKLKGLNKKWDKKDTMWYKIERFRTATFIKANEKAIELKDSGLYRGCFIRDSVIEAVGQNNADNVYVQDTGRGRSKAQEAFRLKYIEAADEIILKKGYATNIMILNRIRTDENKQKLSKTRKEKLSKSIIRKTLLAEHGYTEVSASKALIEKLNVKIALRGKIIVPLSFID